MTGAMIEVTKPGEPRLVALWVFSIMGDETCEYDLEDAKEDVWKFIEENEVRMQSGVCPEAYGLHSDMPRTNS